MALSRKGTALTFSFIYLLIYFYFIDLKGREGKGNATIKKGHHILVSWGTTTEISLGF